MLVAARARRGAAHVVQLGVGGAGGPRPLGTVVGREEEEGLISEAELVVEDREEAADLEGNQCQIN